MKTATYPYKSSDYLDSDEMIAGYAETVLEDDDPGRPTQAIEVIVRAHGLHVLAETTGLPRRALVDALSGEDPDGARTLKEALVATSRLVRTEAAE